VPAPYALVVSTPFPPGFFDRTDPAPDEQFYAQPRLVMHLDDRAVRAVGALYDELHLTGDVLDVMSSWVSHFRTPPRSLTVLGMNAAELDANPGRRSASCTTSMPSLSCPSPTRRTTRS